MHTVFHREGTCLFLIELHADARQIKRINIAINGVNNGRKYAAGVCLNRNILLNCCIMQMNVEMCIDGNSNWRNVGRCMPGDTNPESLA